MSISTVWINKDTRLDKGNPRIDRIGALKAIAEWVVTYRDGATWVTSYLKKPAFVLWKIEKSTGGSMFLLTRVEHGHKGPDYPGEIVSTWVAGSDEGTFNLRDLQEALIRAYRVKPRKGANPLNVCVGVVVASPMPEPVCPKVDMQQRCSRSPE